MKEKAGLGGVRVATLNLWGRRGEWDERRRVLVEGFRELEPELVALQEAVVGDGYDQGRHAHFRAGLPPWIYVLPGSVCIGGH